MSKPTMRNDHDPKRKQNQDVDFYYFITVLKDLSRAWICGYLSKTDFDSMPIVEKGQPTLSGGKLYRATAKRILISQLKKKGPLEYGPTGQRMNGGFGMKLIDLSDHVPQTLEA